jgi:sugar phosphate isomerase/epimerase
MRRAAPVEPFDRSRPSRLRLSCAGYSFRNYLTGKKEPRMSLLEFVDLCASMGCDATEPTGYYFPNPIPDGYFAQLKRRAFVAGLDISGTAIGNEFCLPAGEKRQSQIAHVKKWIDYAAEFGAPTIRIFSGSVPKGNTLEEAQTWFVDACEEACEYAGRKGVFLALENHGGISIPAENMLTLLEKMKSPWFGINLDTGNFRSDDPYKEMEMVAPYAVNVQVKARARSKPTDYERVVGILRRAKYSGYIAVEHEENEDPKIGVPRMLDQLREAIAKTDS